MSRDVFVKCARLVLVSTLLAPVWLVGAVAEAQTPSPSVAASLQATADPGYTPLAESFESVAKGMPATWKLMEFKEGVSTASVVTGDAADGQRFLRITSPEDNHARVAVEVTVLPYQSYRFHAMARAQDVSGDGALLGVDGNLSVTNPGVTANSWTPLDLYINTGEDEKISLTLGLGNFGAMAHGAVDFDDVALTAVGSAPSGVQFVELDPKAESSETASGVDLGDGPSSRLWVFVGVLAFGLTGVAFYLTLVTRPVPVGAEPTTTQDGDAADDDVADDDVADGDVADGDGVTGEARPVV